MNEIRIGKAYEKAFKSVCALVKSGCISSELVHRATEDEIISSGNVFVYDQWIENINSGGFIGINQEGASWFNKFRGGNVEDGDASWLSLIESVATDYHKKYSLIEYDLTKIPEDPKQEKLYTDKTNKLMNILFKRLGLNNFEIRKASQDESITDIYGVSLRIEVSSGTGEAIPLLSKVYFEVEEGKLIPLLTAETKRIDEFISQYIEKNEENQSSDDREIDGQTIDLVFAALDDLIHDRIEKSDFSTSIAFNSEVDVQKLMRMVEDGPYEDVELTCTAVKVFNISRIRWRNYTYDILYSGKQTIQLTYGINNQFDMYCMLCGKSPLIINNDVLLADVYKDKTNHKVIIDLNKDDFGLTEDDIAYINAFSELSQHNMVKECDCSNFRSTKCRQTICATQMLDFNDPDGEYNEKLVKCKNCPYPEIVYYDQFGIPHLTAQMKFARDTLSLVKDKVETCEICGRDFEKVKMTAIDKDGNDYAKCCSFCSSTHDVYNNKEFSQNAKKTYEKYSSMLSVNFRSIHLFSPKYAFEDSDIVLFKIGNSFYKFDKVAIDSEQYLPKPEKTR